MSKFAHIAVAMVLGAGLAPAAAFATGGADATLAVAGEKLYKTACVACHSSGVANAPKVGNKQVWAPLIARGMDSMMEIAIKGKGAMPPRGASSADDATLRAAVEYMARSSQ
ncbi:cytochrome c5 family protein [Candidimonas sp. SYP-B2681]|uniref:c-type cytochrome n=1 Tax=Candidimonas sp. SYP-B2681 TaxID=2497686 RepID=UPI000F862460|nr:c-type cytochrome [Candidimonas sp. SYP-B2681]RTZ45662.1 cytochrome c5 family protein [Candidimonas sp. SYP-B2681]